MITPAETQELARILHDVATQLFETAMVEDEDDTPPPRYLNWHFTQTTHPEDFGGMPVTWLTVELNLVAQSPGNADEDLVARVCKALGEALFSIDPLDPARADTGPRLESDADARLQAARKVLEDNSSDRHEGLEPGRRQP